jgi:hypothetical protein
MILQLTKLQSFLKHNCGIQFMCEDYRALTAALCFFDVHWDEIYQDLLFVSINKLEGTLSQFPQTLKPISYGIVIFGKKYYADPTGAILERCEGQRSKK